jgi:hypothetical protein
MPLCLALLAGCDASLDPIPANTKGTVPEEGSKDGVTAAADRPGPAIPALPKGPERSYQGKTARQWGDSLIAAERGPARDAAWALKILGQEGRPQLLRALESGKPHVRRTALESLSVSEIRAHGDHGRDLLVKLAGDRDDPCIRERACLYLMQWRDVLPAP